MYFEAERELAQILDLMRLHELNENSRMQGMKLLTVEHPQISMYTLRGAHEDQGCYSWLVERGSIEGKLEALDFLHENYMAGSAAVGACKNRYLRNHRPDLLQEVQNDAAA